MCLQCAGAAGGKRCYSLYSCAGEGVILQHDPARLSGDATDIDRLIRDTNNIKVGQGWSNPEYSSHAWMSFNHKINNELVKSSLPERALKIPQQQAGSRDGSRSHMTNILQPVSGLQDETEPKVTFKSHFSISLITQLEKVT